MQEPKTLKEMQDAILLLRKLKSEVPDEEAVFPTITEQMEVLDKYRVAVPDDIRNLEKQISTAWVEYQEALAEADKMLGYSQVVIENLLQNGQEII